MKQTRFLLVWFLFWISQNTFATMCNSKWQVEYRNLRAAINIYKSDCGHLPVNLKRLEVVSEQDKHCYETPFYSDSAVPKDPWGNDYHYELTDKVQEGYLLITKGEDGSLGTDDDVSSENRRQFESALDPDYVCFDFYWGWLTGPVILVVHILVIYWVAKLIALMINRLSKRPHRPKSTDANSG